MWMTSQRKLRFSSSNVAMCAGAAAERARQPLLSRRGRSGSSLACPFYPAVKFAEAQTVTANDIAMTVGELSYAPSVTLARLCFQAPDDRPWQPVVSNTSISLPTTNSASLVADDRSACPIAATCAGVVPQQPPTRLAPVSTSRRA